MTICSWQTFPSTVFSVAQSQRWILICGQRTGTKEIKNLLEDTAWRRQCWGSYLQLLTSKASALSIIIAVYN